MMTEPREPLISHADERLMNPLFESDDQPETLAADARFAVHAERGSRTRVPWLMVLLVASLVFGILGLTANFVAMAVGS